MLYLIVLDENEHLSLMTEDLRKKAARALVAMQRGHMTFLPAYRKASMVEQCMSCSVLFQCTPSGCCRRS